MRYIAMATAGACLLALSATSGVVSAQAQDATWKTAPGSSDFNTAANWTPATVPAGTAFFGSSTITTPSFSNFTSLNGWTFNAGAPAYNFNVGQVVQFNGAGIVLLGLFFLVPLGIIACYSFWETFNYAVVHHWTLDNYHYFFTVPTYVSTMWATLWVSVLATAIAIGMAFPFAYWLSRYVPKRLRTPLLVLVIVYRVGRPGGSVMRRYLPGALVATVLWWTIDISLGWYVRHMPYSVVYGGLAAAIGLLLWMYMTAMVIFVGAAYNVEASRSG